MSAQDTRDHDPSTKPEPDNVSPAPPQDPGRNLRLITLLTVLGLLLFAVWYDYKIARPGVDEAFEIVGNINHRINRSPSMPAMRSQDVQQALGFTPNYTIKKGPYVIEVYAWTAGLPFRSHDYYAVYKGLGTNPVFMRHYKFLLPMDELSPRRNGPQLALAARGPTGPGPNPFEAVGSQWNADNGDTESIERLAIPANGDRTDPDDE